MKNITTFIFKCLILTSFVWNQSSTAAQFGDFTYTESDNEIEVTGYSGSGGNISVPDTINAKPVTSLAANAFLQEISITGIILPDTITSIGDFAFLNCTNLQHITIPDRVVSIGDKALAWCNSLTNITVTAANTEFSSMDGVLYSKDMLKLITYPCGKVSTSFTIPDGVLTIGRSSFEYCRALIEITIPDGVRLIEYSAFRGCRGLTAINLPDSLISIGDDAFVNCDGLTSIAIPFGVTSIGDFAFADCEKLTAITIPDSVESIGTVVFNWCRELTSITIPESVTVIGDGGFGYCPNLSEIFFQGNAPAFGVNFNPGSATIYRYSNKTGAFPSGSVALTQISEPPILYHFSPNAAEGYADININSHPNAFVRLVQADNLAFSNATPVKITATSRGQTLAEGLITDSNGQAALRFNTGANSTCFFRTETN